MIYSDDRAHILLRCYRAKDQYFILLPCHILYKKFGVTSSLYRGQIQKLLQCFTKLYIFTDCSCYTKTVTIQKKSIV